MHYKGTKVFRMVPKFCLCSGDIVNGDGTSGRSIYSKPVFDDEKSGISHDKAGIVTTLQQAGGPNSNGSQVSQYFIWTSESGMFSELSSAITSHDT